MFPRPPLRIAAALFALGILSGRGAPGTTVAADGDALPPRARLRIGTTRLRHGDAVTAIAFARDGRTLATASRDQTVSVWEAATGKELVRCQGHTGHVLSVRFSTIGDRLVSGDSEGTIRIWRLPRSAAGRAAAEEVRTFRISDEEVQTVAFSADASIAAAGTAGGDIVVWDVAEGKRLRHVHQEGQVYCLTLSADGKQLAVNRAANGFAIWDAAEDKEPREFGEGAAASLAFAPDGRTLAVGYHDSRIVLWDTKEGGEKRVLAGHERGDAGQFNGVLGLSFSADGRRLVSGGTDNAVRVWDMENGRELHALKGHRDWVTAVVFAADGEHLASGGADNAVRIWSTDTGRAIRPEREPAAPLSSASLSADGQTLAVIQSSDRLILWDVVEDRSRRCPAALAFSRAACFAPDGHSLAVAGTDGRLRLADLRTRKVRTLERESPRRMDHLVWSADGKALASHGPDHSIDLWDPIKGELLQHMGPREGAYLALAFDRPGRRLAMASESDVIRLWDGSTGRELTPIAGRFAGAVALAFSDDGRSLLAAGGDGTIRLWELAMRKPRRTFSIPTTGITAAAFTPDGRFLAVGTADGEVRLWDVDAGAERHVFRGHRGAIAMLTFAARAPLLASAGRDTTAMVWDVRDLLTTMETLPALDLSAREVETLWENLAGDAPTAYDALRKLRRAPGQTLPYLRGRLRPVRANFTQMLEDLDSDNYNVRVQAFRDLRRFGRVAEKSLRRTLANKPSLEVRRRVEQLLEEMPEGSERVLADPREERAVELLEGIGTAEARRVLQILADGMEEAELTQQARAALARLGRPSSKPNR